jgi:hypothetical protein
MWKLRIELGEEEAQQTKHSAAFQRPTSRRRYGVCGPSVGQDATPRPVGERRSSILQSVLSGWNLRSVAHFDVYRVVPQNNGGDLQ